MKVSEIVEAYLRTERMTKSELCRRVGWSGPALAGRLKRNSFSAEDWIKAMGAMGYELKIAKPGAEEPHFAVGPKVRRTVSHIMYDTSKSTALCDNRIDDDDMTFQELYQDRKGRYFVVMYAMWEGGVHQITPISRADAKDFYERFSGAGDADVIFRGGIGENE